MKVYVYKHDKLISSEKYARDALSRYAPRKSGDLAFIRGKYGKPYLKGEDGLFFSLSHSGEFLICAVARQEIGADVEKVRKVKNSAKIAERCFPGEKIDTEKDFFEAWVKKEAYLKYKGTGFAEGIGENAENVCIKSFCAEDGYAFAVCTKTEEVVEIVKLFS